MESAGSGDAVHLHERTEEGLLPHEVVTTVTDMTKMINGVRAVVIWRRTSTRVSSRAELRFEAQDNAGNIWNLGEYPEEYEDGKFSAAPDVWIAGLDGAEPGNSMVGTRNWERLSISKVGRLTSTSWIARRSPNGTEDLCSRRLLRERDDH